MNLRHSKGMGIAASLLLALASCSSDKDVVMPVEDPSTTITDGNQVVSFVIQNAADVVTRADGDEETYDPDGEDNFVSGEANESEIKDVVLVFFKKDGEFFGAFEPELKEAAGSVNHTQEVMYEAQVSLTVKDGIRPTSVLCIINGKDKAYDITSPSSVISEISLSLDKPNKEKLLKAVGNFDVELDAEGKGPKEPLLMTNSVYVKTVDDAETGVTTKVYDVTEIPSSAFITEDEVLGDDGKYYDAAGNEMKHEKVHIDVERVNTRVKIISKLNEPGNIESTEVNFDGEIVTIVPRIVSIQLSQLTKKSYFVKSLEGSENYDVEDWISKIFPRSYWATCPSLIPWSQKDEKGNFIDENSDYQYSTFDEMEENADKTEWVYYPQENTTAYPAAIIVKTILEKEGEDGKMEPLTDLIDLTGTRKFFITMDSYKKYVANELIKLGLKFHKPGEDGSTIESNDWAPLIDLHRTENADDKPINVMPYLNYGTNPDKINEDDLKAAEEALAEFTPVLCYKDGQSFFYVEILHDLVYHDESGEYSRKKGIVRNHAYEVTLKSLKGLGSPVYDPTDVVIPAAPDEIVELQAEIHPLKWKLVKQETDLK